MELALELNPLSLIGFADGAEGVAFTGMNPATGAPLEPMGWGLIGCISVLPLTEIAQFRHSRARESPPPRTTTAVQIACMLSNEVRLMPVLS